MCKTIRKRTVVYPQYYSYCNQSCLSWRFHQTCRQSECELAWDSQALSQLIPQNDAQQIAIYQKGQIFKYRQKVNLTMRTEGGVTMEQDADCGMIWDNTGTEEGVKRILHWTMKERNDGETYGWDRPYQGTEVSVALAPFGMGLQSWSANQQWTPDIWWRGTSLWVIRTVLNVILRTCSIQSTCLYIASLLVPPLVYRYVLNRSSIRGILRILGVTRTEALERKRGERRLG